MSFCIADLPNPSPSVPLASDEAAGNVKTFTVATILGTSKRQALELTAVRIDYTATATVGTRTLRVQVKQGSTALVSRTVLPNLAASERKQITVLFALPYEPVVTRNDYFDMPKAQDTSPVIAPTGRTIVVEDTANIDALDTCRAYLIGRRS